MIFLLLAEHAIQIVADRGLRHRLLGSLREAFCAGQFKRRLLRAVEHVRALLPRHFPFAEGEHGPNELADAPGLQGAIPLGAALRASGGP